MSGIRLLVDLDGVVADWGPEYDRQLELAGDDAAGIPRPAEHHSFDLNEGRTKEEKKIIRRVMSAPGFYANLQPIRHAREVLKGVRDQGHEVHFVTSPFISNPTCASDKLNWVAKHFGNSWAARTIITVDKTMVRGDILIDDKPNITGSERPEWRHIIFGDYPYNRAERLGRVWLKEWDSEELTFAIWAAIAKSS